MPKPNNNTIKTARDYCAMLLANPAEQHIRILENTSETLRNVISDRDDLDLVVKTLTEISLKFLISLLAEKLAAIFREEAVNNSDSDYEKFLRNDIKVEQKPKPASRASGDYPRLFSSKIPPAKAEHEAKISLEC